MISLTDNSYRQAPSPIPPRFLVEDHHDNTFNSPRSLTNPETGYSLHGTEYSRTPSLIPAVHRESSNARFSDVHEASTPVGYQLALRDGSYTTSSQSDDEAEQYPIPISATNSSWGLSDRMDNNTCSSESNRASPTLRSYSSWARISSTALLLVTDHEFQRDSHHYSTPQSRPLNRRYPPNHFQVAAPGQREHGQVSGIWLDFSKVLIFFDERLVLLSTNTPRTSGTVTPAVMTHRRTI
jgi:hypothetical protein